MLGYFALILLVDVKAFPLARISSESENDLEEELSFMLCCHGSLFNAERIFLVNKVASSIIYMSAVIIAMVTCRNLTMRNKSQVHFLTSFFSK